VQEQKRIDKIKEIFIIRVMRRKAIIIDMAPLFNAPLAQYLGEKGFSCSIVEHPAEAIQALRDSSYDLIAIGQGDPGFPFFELCALAKELQADAHLVLLGVVGEMTNTSLQNAIGFDSALKRPFSLHALGELFENLKEKKIKKSVIEQDTITLPTPLIAQSPAMKSIARELLSIADSKAHVFITGESGSGKEIVAETIHALSSRKHTPFHKINCAAVPESLIESEFFGHEKGAFTGALMRKPGRLELAHEGTLLLDEITESPLSFQAKLLRAVQQQQFERVGGHETLSVDVRFISTSNRDVMDLIQRKLFREDLFYRLHVIPIHIPPLRDRQEDIIPLAERFLTSACKENGKPMKRFSSSAIHLLLSYRWPGNVRELSNLIERTAIMVQDELIEESHLQWRHPLLNREVTLAPPSTLAEMEKKTILETLSRLKNNRSLAAQKLGISVRTLRNKLKEYSQNLPE
jgi:two-component system response regulator AtoC